MNFKEAIKSVYKNTFEYMGRAPRSEYWYFVLFSFLMGIPLNFLVNFDYETVLLINLIYAAAIILPTLSVTSRRFQDAGIPPFVFVLLILLVAITWLVALNMNDYRQHAASNVALIVTGISYITLLVICLKPSDKNKNKYGPNPFNTEEANTELNSVKSESVQGDQNPVDITQPSEREKAIEKSDSFREEKPPLESDTSNLLSVSKEDGKVKRNGDDLRSIETGDKVELEVSSSNKLEIQHTEAKKLFKKELINKDEYDKLRAKILNFD